jgi:hypothetical protein
MMIRYTNGTTREGLLLSQGDGTLRAVVRGVNDAMVFHRVSGNWVAETREPVQIELEWQRTRSSALPDRTDCVYSQEIAERLVRVVRASDIPPNRKWAPSARGAAHHAASVDSAMKCSVAGSRL